MASQSCTHCSAALPLGEVGTVVRCRYCGTDNRMLDLGSARSPAMPPRPALQQEAPPGQRGGLLRFGAGLFGLGGLACIGLAAGGAINYSEVTNVIGVGVALLFVAGILVVLGASRGVGR